MIWGMNDLGTKYYKVALSILLLCFIFEVR